METSISRRRWLRVPGATVGLSLFAPIANAQTKAGPVQPDCRSLCGSWQFFIDPDNTGITRELHRPGESAAVWRSVQVPHTWQVEPTTSEHYGLAWYRREFDVPEEWNGGFVRVEFEAVFHSASVWINGQKCGDHIGKGYTAFMVDAHPHLRFGARNSIVVRVDNAFSESMLPRGRSSDWAHDGGIYRPVNLYFTPKVFVERVSIDALPDIEAGTAAIHVKAHIRNTGASSSDWRSRCRIIDENTGLTVHQWTSPASTMLPAGAELALEMPVTVLEHPKLWHFDHPYLYRLETDLLNEETLWHRYTETFGIRRFEVRNGAFYLNGEKVRPMGVERMAGSNPAYGMAEPAEWLEHDHRDMQELNCVFTRVHWPQDKRTLDYCDRHGILIQTEVPTWGPKTFADMQGEPSPEIMENGRHQLSEMIARDRNHPCIFAWGLCNEIGGQHPAAYRFAEEMYKEAIRLDPHRLRTYASHSLRQNAGTDVSRLMDFVSWNEYYESWMGGTLDDLKANVERVRAAFPGKPIVISEYGYCACTAERPEGDARRIQILREHTHLFREYPEIAGLIFFCYNDYRTHVGDKGLSVLKQRVHGVVDLLGNRKPSFEELRNESSPVEELQLKGTPEKLQLTLRTRTSVPAYTLRGYRIEWTIYGFGDFPAEQHSLPLPELKPGGRYETALICETKEPARVVVNIVRPAGVSVRTLVWRV